MGTRGYYCYRFRGRLYVYYNHWDSYPTILGKFLIENIPIDPQKYQGIASCEGNMGFSAENTYRMAFQDASILH